MDDRFFNAFSPLTTHRVCGYVLRPFSLRHRITLEALGSPMLPGSHQFPKAGDVLLAARICSGIPLDRALGKHSFSDLLWMIRMHRNKDRFIQQVECWRMFVLDTAQHPLATGRQPKDRRDRGLHWALSVVVTLMEMGFTEQQSWDMPESRAMFYFYARAIKDGADIDITTTTMQQRLPAAKEAVMKAVAAANARAAAAKVPGKKNA